MSDYAYDIDDDLIYYEFTCAPLLRFTNIEEDRGVKIKNYINNKITTLNKVEKKYYDEIIDHILYDYRYHYRYIINYKDYYDIINSLTCFNANNSKSLNLPNYFNANKLKQIRNITTIINDLLDRLNNYRDNILNQIKNYCKKNKVYINVSTKRST